MSRYLTQKPMQGVRAVFGRPNLWGQEVDVYYSIEKHWAKL